MKIIIGGGTGLVGRSLITELLVAQHDLWVVGRNKDKIKEIFNHHVHGITWNELPNLNPEEFDVIINLAGENIADHRWSSKVKNKLLSSRIEPTKKFVLWAKNASKKPHLYNASAIGIYGLQKELANSHETYTEESPLNSQKSSFSNHLVNQWEQTALQGMHYDIPVTLMRFGVVLKHGEGMLKKLELPARFGMGAIIGTGKQPLAWIDHSDLVNAILFLIHHPEITGPVNLVAPELISQKEFNKTLAEVLKKPTFLHIPAWLIQMLLGQMGEELLLSGQSVIPERLTKYQFDFKYPSLLYALTKEFKKSQKEN
ncbi:TIGR01777 family oxidoreductase [Legionella rowbothamii]|uniref:TIGR01777 family oxidoreductase n=1 Tax=Legionella rowbothamii TaxID=96229 RepID=UPI001056141E|nr:TIGR01777 family oxidoreductase [Legionella rowbothamii]